MSTPGSPARWEHFPHGADIGIRGIAPTLEGAFEQAALALTAIVVEPQSLAVLPDALDFECEAPDQELLLVDWLNEVIYEMATRQMLFGRFGVHIEGTRLRAVGWGQPMSSHGEELTVEPKGATYTSLSVRQLADGRWCAECVVDV
jgi:tRNA nucleotidyltransferase (CCA-adding enzyme)